MHYISSYNLFNLDDVPSWCLPWTWYHISISTVVNTSFCIRCLLHYTQWHMYLLLKMAWAFCTLLVIFCLLVAFWSDKSSWFAGIFCLLKVVRCRLHLSSAWLLRPLFLFHYGLLPFTYLAHSFTAFSPLKVLPWGYSMVGIHCLGSHDCRSSHTWLHWLLMVQCCAACAVLCICSMNCPCLCICARLHQALRYLLQALYFFFRFYIDWWASFCFFSPNKIFLCFNKS